eukprot:CAMPEP_0175865012 /NCGR_PEP_ID=MMETSP0107_2-20121207/33413_1 /TAXON_ID=195067 ORGANISM="Goniomonas pacifica, Strain CCMP1869" /NCGR_SAMPLE_ID=MMETSP0107_2 /ASSEMBLY_ACC=CAM_ASM_000203 /LENGTH=183 /DNA_ID=CAMNT_0017182373 /DNA_START=508 /DNA_END=1056 /DNA_ORIENTATION=-
MRVDHNSGTRWSGFATEPTELICRRPRPCSRGGAPLATGADGEDEVEDGGVLVVLHPATIRPQLGLPPPRLDNAQPPPYFAPSATPSEDDHAGEEDEDEDMGECDDHSQEARAVVLVAPCRRQDGVEGDELAEVDAHPKAVVGGAAERGVAELEGEGNLHDDDGADEIEAGPDLGDDDDHRGE